MAIFLFLASEQFFYSEATSILPRKNAYVNTFLYKIFIIFVEFSTAFFWLGWWVGGLTFEDHKVRLGA